MYLPARQFKVEILFCHLANFWVDFHCLDGQSASLHQHWQLACTQANYQCFLLGGYRHLSQRRQRSNEVYIFCDIVIIIENIVLANTIDEQRFLSMLANNLQLPIETWCLPQYFY